MKIFVLTFYFSHHEVKWIADERQRTFRKEFYDHVAQGS